MRPRDLDLRLVIPALLVFGAGLAHLHAIDPSHRLLARQAAYGLLGLGAAALTYRAVVRGRHQALSWVHGAALALVLLCALGFHAPMRNVRRWLRVGPLLVQPSELLKLGLVLALARWFGDAPLVTRTRWRDAAGIGALVALPVAAVAAQPDLGTATVLVGIAATTLAVTPHARRSLALLAAMTALPAAALPGMVLHEYQRARIRAFFSPLAHGALQWQSEQSRAGFELGRWLGADGAAGSIARIPDGDTDFVLASWANRAGWVGVMLVLGAHCAIVLRAFETARAARERYDIALATGIGAMLLWPVVINAAMTLGVLPVVGIPFPLMSFGGSSLVTTLAALGALLGLRARLARAPSDPELPGPERLYRGTPEA